MRLQYYLIRSVTQFHSRLLMYEYKNTLFSDAFILRYSPEKDVKWYSIKEVSDFLLGYDLRGRGVEMTSDDSILEICGNM